jgi:hypothetical protein
MTKGDPFKDFGFRNVRSLQKGVTFHSHFIQERSLYSRESFNTKRKAARSEWRGLGAA